MDQNHTDFFVYKVVALLTHFHGQRGLTVPQKRVAFCQMLGGVITPGGHSYDEWVEVGGNVEQQTEEWTRLKLQYQASFEALRLCVGNILSNNEGRFENALGRAHPAFRQTLQLHHTDSMFLYIEKYLKIYIQNL